MRLGGHPELESVTEYPVPNRNQCNPDNDCCSKNVVPFSKPFQLIFPFLTQSLVDVGIRNVDIGFVYLVLIAQLMIFLGQISVVGDSNTGRFSKSVIFVL